MKNRLHPTACINAHNIVHYVVYLPFTRKNKATQKRCVRVNIIFNTADISLISGKSCQKQYPHFVIISFPLSRSESSVGWGRMREEGREQQINVLFLRYR